MTGKLPRNVLYCASELSIFRPGIHPSERYRSYLGYLGSEAVQTVSVLYIASRSSDSGLLTLRDIIGYPEHVRDHKDEDEIVEEELGRPPFRRRS